MSAPEVRVETELADFFDNAAVGFFCTDADGTLLQANRAQLEMLGRARADAVGRRLDEFIAVPDEAREMLERLRRGETLRDFRVTLRRRDGLVEARVDASVLRHEGRMMYARGVMRDMSEGRRLEEDLRRANAKLTQDVEARTKRLTRSVQVLRKQKAQRIEVAEQYRALVASARDIVVTTAPDGTLTSLNPAFEHITGWSPDEWIGRTFTPLVHPEDLALTTERFAQAVGGECPPLFETRVATRAGSYVVVESLIKPQTHGGEVVGVLAIVRDVTARRRAEESLRATQERFRVLVDGIEDYAITMLDADGAVASWNLGAQRTCGYSAEEIVGRHFSVFYTPEDRAAGKPEDLLRTAEAKGRCVAEGIRVRKDGSQFWARIAVATLRGDDGRLRGFAEVAHDITERREAEKLQVLLAAIVNGSDDAIIGTDLDGAIIAWNPGAERIYGYSAAEVLGRPIGLLTGGHREAEEADIARSVAKGGRIDHYETERMRKDGREIPVSMTISPIRDASDRIAGVSRIERDISERKRAEAERERLNAQLLQGQKVQAIGQLAAGIAHEINNPVGFILSNLTTLGEYLTDLRALLDAALEAVDPRERERLEEKRREVNADFVMEDFAKAIEESRTGAERIRDIVANFKEFAHVDEGEVKSTDLNRAIETSIRICWNELKYKATVERDYGELPPVRCYPQRVIQVFVNLLVNAAQAIRERGVIGVSTRLEGGEAVIRIRDTGCGIRAEHVKRLFEPFFTTKPVGVGTGLGLHVAYQIVRAHGGRIEVSSAVDCGTEFTVRLPVEGPPGRSS